MDDCIFCKIIKGEIPCFKVYEDADFLGFLDINPLNPGNSFVKSENKMDACAMVAAKSRPAAVDF